MTALAFPWHDDTRAPIRQKAEQAVDAFRRIHGADAGPDYLRTGLHDALQLAAAGFSDVKVLPDENVQRGCFYAVGRTP